MVTKLKLRPSYRLAALLALSHAGAAATLPFLDLAAELQVVLACAVAASFVLAVRRSALLTSRGAIVALEWNDDGAVSFQTRDGIWQAARIAPATFVTPMVTVIALRATARPRARHVVLMADSAAGDEYRRLRVRLQWDRTGYA